jgi:hypothetical protein
MARYPQLKQLIIVWEDLTPRQRRELTAIGRALRDIQKREEGKRVFEERIVADDALSGE